MKEQFDKKLTEKIRDTFDQFEEPYDPAQWKKLSEAYFQAGSKRKRSPFLWPLLPLGIAASLLLVVFFGPWREGEEYTQEQLANLDLQSTEIVKEEGPSFEEREGTLDEISEERILKESVVLPDLADKTRQTKDQASLSELPREQRRNSGTATKNSESERQNAFVANGVREEAEVAVPGVVQVLPEQTQLMGSILNPGEEVAESNEVDQAQKAVNQWLAAADESADSPIVPKQSTPLKLGVLLSSQASSNAVSGMNLGAGIMSEISFSRRMRLDIGMTYARQSLSPDLPPSVVMASEYAGRQTVQMAMADNIRASTNYLGSSSQLSLTSLDIPVNLKYLVLERKNAGVFLITGLSSMVYLDQSATETFETTSFFTTTAEGLSFVPTIEKFTSVFRPEGRGGTDLGGMVNLSVGYEYNLKNGMFISVEPFYKLPLGDLTFVNQQFSVAGMNLRMNFHLKK